MKVFSTDRPSIAVPARDFTRQSTAPDAFSAALLSVIQVAASLHKKPANATAGHNGDGEQHDSRGKQRAPFTQETRTLRADGDAQRSETELPPHLVDDDSTPPSESETGSSIEVFHDEFGVLRLSLIEDRDGIDLCINAPTSFAARALRFSAESLADRMRAQGITLRSIRIHDVSKQAGAFSEHNRYLKGFKEER